MIWDLYTKIQTGPIFFFFLAEFGQAGAVPYKARARNTLVKADRDKLCSIIPLFFLTSYYPIKNSGFNSWITKVSFRTIQPKSHERKIQNIYT